MKYYSKVLIIVACVISAAGYADTFKHKESGEVFTGFVTQKTAGGKTLVYNSEEGKMTPVVLSDYDITYDRKGRKDNVYLLELTNPEILLSGAVSTKVAAAITETSNRGPQAIIIQIDSPGGRGDYMKTVVDAILKTKNCPVIAYISGGTYGGAYSAAAIIALACEKVYINSVAGIGAVSPVSGEYFSDENYAYHLSLYNSESLLTYSSYVNALAQKRNHLEELLLRAFIDKRISIIEVVDINGSRQFIGKDDRQPTQTLIRTLSEGMTVPQKTTELSPEDVIGKVLSLTAQDAVDLGLASAYAESAVEILSDMQMAELKITPIPGIETTIKKYTAAKRNISESLAIIDFYEKNIESLSEQFTTIDKQLRLGTQTREVVRGEVGYRTRRSRERFPSNYDYYYYNQSTGDIARTGRNRRRDDNRYPTAEKITTEEPLVSIQLIYTQLTGSLRDLVSEYRKTLNLTKRWPGGLPPELNRSTLQKNMDSASAELDNLYRYRPVYPNQAQPQSQQRSGRYRRR